MSFQKIDFSKFYQKYEILFKVADSESEVFFWGAFASTVIGVSRVKNCLILRSANKQQKLILDSDLELAIKHVYLDCR